MATTADEVWQLLGELVQAQKEQREESARMRQEADRRSQQMDRRFQEQREEADRRSQETDRLIRELREQSKKTDRQIQELGKQIGGLGQKFGSFTEGLALPSMETILFEKFGMEVVTPSARVSKQGKHIELDVLAYANGEVNTAIVVEVKSHARPESITQLIKHLQQFREFFPEHQDKKLYGILAAVDLSNALREEVLKAGLYAARIRDEIFELDIPATFQPRVW
ncbi:tektin family protein [Synechocystis sp. B12]|nr:tektin family protein [Synechocystis sp. B12]